MSRIAPNGSAIRFAYALIFLLVNACGDATPRAPLPHACPVESLTLPPPSKPALTFVLVDRSDSYVEHIRPGLLLMAELISTAQPGERIIGAWVGGRSGQPTETFFNQRLPLIPLPEIPAPPTAPSYEAKQTEGGKVKADRQFKVACKEYQERHSSWRAATMLQITRWNTEQNQAHRAFVEAAQAQVRNQAFEIDRTGTLIQEALFDAATAFARSLDGAPYERKALIIFSDMVEFRSGRRDADRIDLRGVRVVAAGVPYDRPKDFSDLEVRWTKQFEGYQVTSIEVLPVRSSTVDAISARLKGKP